MSAGVTGEIATVAVTVMGPTGSGKSDLAMALAASFDCEIICCDSMQVYTGLDIGTGKPTMRERSAVKHHLLDVVTPNQDFHAGAWARKAREVLQVVCSQGKLPIIVGGTGLYLRALIQGLFEAPPSDPEIRARHKAEADVQGVHALHARLAVTDPQASLRISPNDLVRISRSLEVWEQTGETISELWRKAQPQRPLQAFSVVYDRPAVELRSLIDRRVDSMIDAGFLAEVQSLRAQGYGGARALCGLGYKELSHHLNGHCELPEAVAEMKKATVAYARRQRTWFRKEGAAVRLPGAPDVGQLVRQINAWRAALAGAP